MRIKYQPTVPNSLNSSLETLKNKKWTKIHTITDITTNGVYTIPDISNYKDIGFILYGKYGCSEMLTYPYDILITLNGSGTSDYCNRPILTVAQNPNNYMSILISIVSNTSIRCDTLDYKTWDFVKLEIYGK